jgi:amino acid transporter
MVAVSFGAYGSSLFFGDDANRIWDNVLASLIVVAMAVLNLLGPKIVAKAQSLIVWVLLAVFAFFAVVTLADIDPSLLSPSDWPSWSKIVASVALTFFAYLGFSVITFTAGDLDDPKRSLPKAMYLSLGITVVLYIAVSLGVFGALTVDEVIEHGDTALAEAARPALGDAGFTIMAIAALLATASSVNSNIFAGDLRPAGPLPRHPRRHDHGRPRPDPVERLRPERDRLARQRGLSDGLPRGRAGRPEVAA